MELRHEHSEISREAAYPGAGTSATTPGEMDTIVSGEVAALIENVNQGVVKQKRFLKNMSVVPAVLPLVMALLIFVIRAKLGNDVFLEWITQPTTFAIFACVILTAPLLIFHGLRQNTKSLDSAAERLLEPQDINLVGPLVDLLSVDNATVRKNAALALTELLPKLAPSDASRLNPAQRTRLIRHLSLNPDTLLHKDISDFIKSRFDKQLSNIALDFQVAILQSYEYTGGALELPTVTRLANAGDHSKVNERLRVAAATVLLTVEHRAEIERSQGILLRPSESEVDDQALLRPVQTRNESESAILLRVNGAVE